MNSLFFRYRRLFSVLLFLGILIAAFQLSGLREHFSLAFLQQKILANRIEGLLVFILLFSLGNLVQIPGWLFLAAAVLTLGEVMGGLATYVAACISCAVTFLTIRLIGGDVLRKLDGKYARKIFSRLDTAPVKSIFYLRVLFQTVPALNYALAMSGVSFRKYMLGTLLGLPLPIMLYCIFFDYLARLMHLS
jgi:uncharacterized membrane protein YdjX (TVP38/TMEM64 family)